MSAKARYRLANWGMWLLLALFVALFLFGFALKSLPASAAAWFVLALLFMVIAGPALFLLALYAFLTVRCGECDERFFDLVFLGIYVQGGCQFCGASMERAQTRRLRDIGQQ